jgi:hypothetical protein
LANKTYVELNIYDLSGGKVETLINQIMETGMYDVDWNASSFASGVYVYALESNGERVTKKMVLIK